MAMAAHAVKPSWNPLRFDNSELPMSLTVMAKSLALVLLLTGHVRILPDPWLPFVPGIDLIPGELYQRTLQTVFVLSALAILFNRRIRLAALLLGGTLLLSVVSSKAYYGNNKTFCGLMLFLTGLHIPGTEPRFHRWQLAVTYFGAGLNKVLDPDWHSGLFFENWAVNRLKHAQYIAVDGMLPPLVLGKFFCWTTIVTELAIVPAIFIRSLHVWAAYANILFQSGLMLFTGTTFTLFFYSMTAASLAFVTWPTGKLSVLCEPGSGLASFARKVLAPWDADGRFVWTKVPAGQAASWLQLRAGEKTYSGFRALRMIVLLNPLTYFVIAGLIAAIPESTVAPLLRRIIVGGSLALLLPPLAYLADLTFGSGTRNPASVMEIA
jgi:hypothetical protein